jgi:hypothetical protein
MGLNFLVAIVILLIVVVVTLDALGVGWVVRKFWRRDRAGRKPQ